MTASARCGGCKHAAHRGGKCRGKGPSGCVPFDAGNGSAGFICGPRPGCPCAWRTCKCGALVATAEMGEWAVPVLRGSANDPAGTLAVRRLLDGTLGCRELADGESPHEKEWRGVEHTCEFELLNPEPVKAGAPLALPCRA